VPVTTTVLVCMAVAEGALVIVETCVCVPSMDAITVATISSSVKGIGVSSTEKISANVLKRSKGDEEGLESEASFGSIVGAETTFINELKGCKKSAEMFSLTTC